MDLIKKYNNRISYHMNNSQLSSSSQGSNNEEDLQKLHNIWKNIKRTKDSFQKQNMSSHNKEGRSIQSNSSVKKAIIGEEQKNLQTRLVFTQKQYGKARENNVLLLKKLSEAEDSYQYLNFEMEKVMRQKNEEIQQLINENKRLRKEVQYDIEKMEYEAKQKQYQENNQLKKRIEYKQKQLERMNLKVKSVELDRKNMQNQIKNLNDLNQIIRKKLQDAQNAMNQTYLGDHSKGTQLLELDEASKTIERLAIILRNTDEYKKFGNFIDDVKQIHFLKNIPKRMKSNSLNYPTNDRRRVCSCTDIKIDERLLWTPGVCYKILLQMKMKYQQLSQDCIEEALFELNKAFLAKEEAHINRIRESYEVEITRLKKKTEERYDELVARKQIQRLKKQLQQTKYKKGSHISPTENLQMLKNIGQYQDELRLKQKQIKLLQQRIKLIETQSTSYDKVLYLEGALWIIDKILEEIDKNNEDVRDFQSRFRDNSHTITTNEAWISAFKEFFETISELNSDMVEKLMLMKDSTLRKMGTNRGMRESTMSQSKKY